MEAQTRSVNAALLAELKHETANTRKLLERVPIEKSDWKPHAKSMTLGRLAQHVAELVGWVTMTINKDELSFDTKSFTPRPLPASTEELLKLLDNHLTEALGALENASDDHMNLPWSLKVDGHTVFTLPRKAVIRSMAMNHLIHHRGQLSVYLRLLDVPIPGMYGPSADER